MNQPSFLRNPWISHLLKFGLSLGVVVYLLRIVDGAALMDAFERSNPLGVLVSVLFVTLGVVYFQAMEINQSMRPENRVSVWDLCRINLSLMFYALFLPAGLTFVVRWDKYRRAGYDGYDSVALVGFHKLLQLGIAGAVSLVALYVVRDTLGPYGQQILFVVALAMAALLVCLWAAVGGLGLRIANRFFRHMNVGLSQPQTSLFGRFALFGNKIVNRLGGAFAAFGALGMRQGVIVGLWGCLQHAFIVLSSWVVVDMVAPGVSILSVAFVRSVVVILLSFPISVGGLGVRELAFFTLFPLFGVSSEAALSASLILFFVQLIVSAFGALVELDAWIRPKTSVR